MKPGFLTFAACLCCLLMQGQDYIITWSNDTISCMFPEKPGKEGVRPASRYENGHIRVLTYFPGDSVRVIEAGEVKTYQRNKHGRGFLCNGFFESKKISAKDRSLMVNHYFNRDQEAPVFYMRRLTTGSLVQLYVIYIECCRSSIPYYFIGESNTAPEEVRLLRRKKEIMQLAGGDEEIIQQLKAFRFKRTEKGYKLLIDEYNRLKTQPSQVK